MNTSTSMKTILPINIKENKIQQEIPLSLKNLSPEIKISTETSSNLRINLIRDFKDLLEELIEEVNDFATEVNLNCRQIMLKEIENISKELTGLFISQLTY